jgi:hypothetical protein
MAKIHCFRRMIREVRKRMRLVLFFVAALTFVQVPSPLSAQEENEVWQKRWAEAQKAKYERLRTAYQRRGLEARNALERAQNVLRLAETVKDQKASLVAQEAIRKANLALERVRVMQAMNEDRLNAFDRVLRWQREGRSEAGVRSVVKGKMYKKTSTGWSLFNDGSPLLEGEEVRTGPDGFSELIFTGGSTMQLGANTNLKAIKLETNHSIFGFVEGRIHAEFQCLKKALKPCKEIRLRHGAGATLAVRGTEVDMETPPDGLTKVIVLEGLIEISSPGAEKIVKAETGEMVTLTADGMIQDPTLVDLHSLEHWWEGR